MSIDPVRGRRLIAAAAAAGLIVRLAFALLYWVDRPLTHDEREYLALAASLTEGRGFAYDASHEAGSTPQYGRAPVYPLFLAAVGAGTRTFDSAPARVQIAQSIVGALGVWLIGLLAARAGGPRAGVAAASIAAVYPPLVWISAYVLSETLYSALALAAVMLLDLALDRTAESERRTDSPAPLALLSGALTGVAILVRPAMLFFLPLAALWLLYRRQAKIAVLLVAAAVVVVAPWTVRNVHTYGRFVLVASEGGVTFWTGNHPLSRGEGDLAANPQIKLADLAFREAHPGLTAEELEPLYYREALRYIASHPGEWLLLLVRKAFYTVVPAGPSYTLHSTKYLAASVASYVILLPFAAAGVRRWRTRRGRPETLFLLAASAVLVSLVFFPQERFRIPVIDPTLIVCAGMACAERVNRR